MRWIRKPPTWILLYGPPLLLVVLFCIYPLMKIIELGFTDDGGSLTFDHIHSALFSESSREIILFTLGQALVSTIATLALAFPGAYLISRYRFRGRSILLSLTTVPFVLPPLVLAMGFFTMFGTSGHVNSLIGSLNSLTGLNLPELKLLYTGTGIVLAHMFFNFPVALRILHSRFNTLDPNQIRASRSLGAGPVRTWSRIILPQMRYSILAAASLVFTFCFLSFGVVLVVGGMSNATIEVEIFRQFSGRFDFSLAGALLTLETIIVLLTTSLYLWSSRKAYHGNGTSRGSGIEESRGSGRPVLRSILIALYIFLVSVVIIGQLLSVVHSSFTSGAGHTGDLSLHWFSQVLSRTRDAGLGTSPFDAVVNSLVFGFLTAIISVPVSYVVAHGLKRKGHRFKTPADLMLLFPMGVSTIGLGYGLTRAYSGTFFDLSGTWYIVVLVQVVL